MGYYEYFLHSKNNKVSVEEMASTLLRRSKGITDILCGAETKIEIASDKVRMFGTETDITPVHINASTTGVVIGSDLYGITSSFTALDKLRFQPEAVCLDDIMLSTNVQNAGKTYADYFTDRPIVVNGETYMSKQTKSESLQTNPMSISTDELKERLDDHKLWLETRDNYNVQGKKLDLYEADIPGADLSGLDLTDAVFAYTDLQHVNFTNTILKHAVMGYTDLTGAILTGADMTNANCQGADFTRADLTNTNLTGADCTHATFNDANLTHTNMTNADMTNAVGMNTMNGVPILTDADLDGLKQETEQQL